MSGPGDGVDDNRQGDDGVVVVGYAFMPKKMDSMSKVSVRAYSTPQEDCPFFFACVPTVLGSRMWLFLQR